MTDGFNGGVFEEYDFPVEQHFGVDSGMHIYFWEQLSQQTRNLLEKLPNFKGDQEHLIPKMICLYKESFRGAEEADSEFTDKIAMLSESIFSTINIFHNMFDRSVSNYYYLVHGESSYTLEIIYKCGS